ncbi:ubiquitin hydrolase [Aspergillus bombycis]|uniref:Ubiquitin carboxyl-terminal hydrolase n=1 Tax=Aspergillus bombycis TaxID=109264 RepID=A0A1F7ZI77_9EURO|nr:ubiquitin hydrolase [Aspergillus bombycis]OGM39157.1 ubiquitin hydrolase [Aspergillus bombycis]
MTSCMHVNSHVFINISHVADLKPPSPSQAVYREDCTQCFDSIDDEAGLNVCLTCFNGGCAGDREHASLHFKRLGHPLALNIRRTRKKVQRDEPPHKISKLAIAAETDEDRYDTTTRVICYSCGKDDIDETSDALATAIGGILNAMSFSKQEEVKAWEQEFVPCEHTLCLNQRDSRHIGSKDLSQCSMCDLKENLWLCLECGNLGCGRSQFGGIGGNSHALAHADLTSHAIAVKLGSITADGSADIYCYKCNEERTDPDLAVHLAHWGINLARREKTEKSLMEMQVEHNLKWDFSMTSEDGQELSPIFGPGFTGLANLGNSCYLSSVIQCLFDLPEFQQRYHHENEEPPLTNSPAEDLETQLRKLADGILSGRYSRADMDIIVAPDSPEVPHQKGLIPAMFKHLVGRGHEEFSTMKQQDAFEFLLHLFKLINLSRHPGSLSSPTNSFMFAMEQRLQCMCCKKVRYKVDEQDNVSIPVPARRLALPDDATPTSQFAPVTLFDCLDASTSEEIVDLICPSCGSKDGFSKRSSFRTLPQQLVINARRFELINWVPTKLDIPVDVSEEPLDLSPYLSSGQKEGEELLPEIDTSKRDFVPNQYALDQLLSMGFPRARSEKALYTTGNSDPEAAMNWLFAHLEDPDIDEPLTSCEITGEGTNASHDPAKVAQLVEMGINESRAKRALGATDEDINRAIDWVFSHPEEQADVEDNCYESNTHPSGCPGTLGYSDAPAKYELRSIVCHKGSSVHAGHYVAFVRKNLPGQSELSWVMFNDEKVVKAEDIQEMKKYAYLYFFSRV